MKIKIFRHHPISSIMNIRNNNDQNKIILDYPPKYITIGITGYCIYKCKFCASHCPESGQNTKTKNQYDLKYNMSYEQFCKIVDMAHKSKVPKIHIAGQGEPFLNKNILKMIDYLASKYGQMSLQTDFDKNLFIKKDLYEEIIKRENYITTITTDLFPSVIHNDIKRGSNYDDVVEAMRLISYKTSILFKIHVIVTKSSYMGIKDLLKDLYEKNIYCQIDIVNLHPLNFNEFTSFENIYTSSDIHITRELIEAKKLGKKYGILVNIPEPFDKMYQRKNIICSSFWKRFQIMPDKRIPKEKWIGNVIPSQCNAVVEGNLDTLGNIFEYDNLMDFWNNDKIVGIRRNLLEGTYPDNACQNCMMYKKNN